MFTMMCSVFCFCYYHAQTAMFRANLCNAKSSRQVCNTDNAVIHDTILYYIAQRKKKVYTITGSNQTLTAESTGEGLAR